MGKLERGEAQYNGIHLNATPFKKSFFYHFAEKFALQKA
jgi:hypothetical protein